MSTCPRTKPQEVKTSSGQTSIISTTPPTPPKLADALLAYGRNRQGAPQTQTTPDSQFGAAAPDGVAQDTGTGPTPTFPSVSSSATSGYNEPTFQLTGGRDDSDYSKCNQECSWILERPKPYRSWDGNKFDYHKCVADCLERNRQKLNPAPQPFPSPRPLPWWFFIPRILPELAPALAQDQGNTTQDQGQNG